MTYITLERLKDYSIIHGVSETRPNTPWAVKLDASINDYFAMQNEVRKITGKPVYFEATAIRANAQ